MQIKTFAGRLYFCALLLLAASLPFWLLLMSLSQFIMAGAWLLHGDIKAKLRNAFHNKALLAVLGIYIMHVAGVFYSSDLKYAFDDLRVKLPLLLLPLFIATMPMLSLKQFRIILITVVLSVFASTLCSAAILTGLTGLVVEDIRDVSPFISHIRLSLLICMSVVFCIYLAATATNRIFSSFLFLLVIWFVAFLFLLQSLTGLAILTALGIASVATILIRRASVLSRIASLCFLLLLLAGGAVLFKYLFVDSVRPLRIEQSMLKDTTALGNAYIHNPSKQDEENGYPVWINVNETELRNAWNKRSPVSYDGFDLKNQEIKYTLIRFLASCGYNKDAEGVNRLTEEELKAVESGIANRNYIYNSSIKTRLQQLAWEYRSYYYSGNPSGHSVMQRLEFWKTGLYIFRKNMLFGTGTGDIKNAFAGAYNETGSRLLPKFRLRTHNEYLTMFITFGVFGGLYFLFALIYPYFRLRKRSDVLYTGFLIILMLSMLMEDTPESQPGATFMAFFNGLLLFHDYGRLSKR